MLCFCRRTELLSQTWVDGLQQGTEEEQAANGGCGTIWFPVLVRKLKVRFTIMSTFVSSLPILSNNNEPDLARSFY